MEWHSSVRVADKRILPPDVEGLKAECAVTRGGHEVTPRMEVAVDQRVCGKEGLCLTP